MVRKLLVSFFFAFVGTFASAQEEKLDVRPGVDRWTIKTTAVMKPAKKVPLTELLKLPLMDPIYSRDAYNARLVPKRVRGLLEGDIITTEGYLHLVALERSSGDYKDGDYHIQITGRKVWSDSCLIVETPYPEFLTGALKDSARKCRQFVRERMLKDRKPAMAGTVIKEPVYVRVTGQLFYDAIHAGQMRTGKAVRGKSGKQTVKMRSYTAWELHPVVHIEEVKAPK